MFAVFVSFFKRAFGCDFSYSAQIFPCVLTFVFVMYSSSYRGPQNFYKLQAPQNLDIAL